MIHKILICQHGGSGNHGCEALARTTIELLSQAAPEAEIELYSYRKAEDQKYLMDIPGLKISGLNGLPGKYSLHNLRYHWQKRQNKPQASKLPLTAEFKQAVAQADLVIAIGGDNYCYKRGEGYYALDNYIKSQGKPYILLGCSIEPEDLPQGLARHLRVFDLITARESISHQAMQAHGLDHVALCPDSAFLLPPQKMRLPAGFSRNNTVGINISPLIIDNEAQSGVTLDNYRALIKYILGNSKMQIALIPHVVWPDNDDRQVLQKLADEFNNDGRICIVGDADARNLKYAISQLRFFVGARTHATIAAYSSLVPTLTVGYSVKAKGIAKDLFDTDENYVIPVQSLQKEDDLTQAFIWLMKNESDIRKRLKEMMPAYTAQARGAALYLERMAQGKELLLPLMDGPKLVSRDRCTGCGLCAQVCPQGCIAMATDGEGFLYPEINHDECTNCHLCSKACPARSNALPPLEQEAYAAYLLDEKVRLESASGGIFTPLALDLLTHGGLVAGAVYDNDWSVRHVLIEKVSDLPLLTGSKYAQSDVRSIYPIIEQALALQRPVLFSGTPCQTAAVRALTNDHDYLLTVAVACHGVPSSKVFLKYLSEAEQKRGFRVTDINFKHKGEGGWHTASTRIRFSDDSYRDELNSQSPYMRAFLHNLSTRPSCHECYAKGKVCADLMIGDYWGVEKFTPELDDNKGVSIILPQTDKGRAALEGISKHLKIKAIRFNDAVHYNQVILKPSPYNPRRTEFFRQLELKTLRELVTELIPEPSGFEKFKRKVKRAFRGI